MQQICVNYLLMSLAVRLKVTSVADMVFSEHDVEGRHAGG
jgi:hypothetical protein